MRIKINEDLEQDLKDRAAVQNLTKENLDTLFEDNGFIKNVVVNGVSYENQEDNIYASFYVDPQLNYKGYVTDNSSNSTNYSVKGEMNNVLDAAQNIIDQYYNLIS